MKKSTLVVLVIGLLSTVSSYAQEVKYLSMADAYERIAETGLVSTALYKRLGDYYYFKGDYAKSKKWYETLLANKGAKNAPDGDVSLEYYFRYANVLRYSGEYEKSDELMQKFRDLDTQVSLDNQKSTFENYLAYQSNRIVCEESIKTNSRREEYAPVYLNKNYMLFSSARIGRKNSQKNKIKNGFIKPNWLIAKYSRIDSASGKALNRRRFIDFSDLAESTPSFSKDGKTVFFTKRVCKGDNLDICVLNLFKAAVLENGEWNNIEGVSFNDFLYDLSHPSISHDGNFLYFTGSTDKKSPTDIYVSEIKGSTFGLPVKVSGINTTGSEIFPYAGAEGDLFFSSNGHNSLGGFDIFVGKLVNYKTVERVYNLGTPVNSEYDETSIAMDPVGKRGYFSSNRPLTRKWLLFFNIKQSQNLYSFHEESPLVTDCTIDISGKVTDRKTSDPVAGTEVFLIDDKNNVLERQVVGNDGQFKFSSISCNDVYFVRARAKTYITSEKLVERSILIGTYTNIANISLDKEGIEIPDSLLSTTSDFTGVDIITGSGEKYGLEPIYFELNRDEVTKKSKDMLDAIVSNMKTDPNLIIEIRSYADSRGGENYNLRLSSKRAFSTLMYLIYKGVDPMRVSMKALGEHNPVNKCKDGVPCSEQQYRLNRRSEFSVIRQ